MGGLSELRRSPGSAIERWFAAQGTPPALDLARSGAAPLSIGEVLHHGDRGELHALLHMPTDYGDGQGEIRLRSAVAGAGFARSAEEVLVTHGAAEALLLACTAAAGSSPGDALVAGPAYGALLGAPHAAGLRTRLIPAWQPGATRLDLARLTGAVNRNTRVVVVNTPHNPGGAVATESDIDVLARQCAAVGAVLIIDEVSLATSSPGAASAARAPTFAEGSMVVCGDVSKALGLGGLRVGWLTTASRGLLARGTALKDLVTVSNAVATQLVAAIALEHRDALLTRTARWAAANLQTAVALATACRGDLTLPVDGLVVLPRLPMSTPATVFAEWLRRDADVGVVPGCLFGYPDRVRLGLGLDPDIFTLGAERIADAVRAV